MTIEKLALRVRNGDHGALLLLWDGTERFITLRADTYYRRCKLLCDRAGVTPEDLSQSGFLALCEAARGFEPDRGMKFLSYLDFHLKRNFRALCGIRTSKRDPLNECLDLDAPVPGSEEFTLADTVKDPADAFAEAENREYVKQLHQALEDCMKCLTEQQYRCIIGKYYCGMTLRQIGEREGTSPDWIRQVQDRALELLRYPQRARKLSPFLEEMAEAKAYQGTGFHAWKSRGSAPERVTEWKLGF